MGLSTSSCSCYPEGTGPGALGPSFCPMECRQWGQHGARVRSWQGCSSAQFSSVAQSCPTLLSKAVLSFQLQPPGMRLHL